MSAGRRDYGVLRWGKLVRTATTAIQLREADEVGKRAVVIGHPHVENWGTMRIGDDFRLGSRPARSHLVVTSGKLLIGNRVVISYGAAISSQLEIAIEDDVQLGPFVVIMDSDYHVAGDRSALAKPAPVRVGQGAMIGARVTILRGSEIGRGATILSGSVVSGVVAPGTLAGGVPARPAGQQSVDDDTDISGLVMRILGLTNPPQPHHGPAEIPEWDSLGTLKLLLALEERFEISLAEEEVKSAQSVAALSELVAARL